METLAYTHLAAAYEESANIEPPIAVGSQKSLGGLSWKKLARRASIPVISIALSFFNLGNRPAEAALQRGNTGPEVTDLQNQLIDSGFYDGPVTGYFGELTENAVKRLQQTKGQTATGIVDDKTFSYLQPADSGTTDGTRLALGDKGQYVTDLQNNLKATGHYNGPISGYFGSLTEKALMEFQRDRGLDVDGIAGEQTLMALQQVATATTPAEPASQSDMKVDERIEEAIADLTPGTSGPQVAALQTRLQAAGCYNGAISGSYDSATEAAVRSCQSLKDSDLTSESQPIAPDTVATAESAPIETVMSGNLSRGASGPGVTELQNRLQAAGYYEGQASGSFDDLTEAAVLRFQRDQGLNLDGIAGPATQGLLTAKR